MTSSLFTPLAIVLVGSLIAFNVRRHVSFALIALQLFLVFVGAWGAYKLETRQDDLETTQNEITQTQKRLTKERLVRSRVQAEINRYVCTENNKQDRILAGLIEVSIGGQSSFGDGIDKSALSPLKERLVRRPHADEGPEADRIR